MVSKALRMNASPSSRGTVKPTSPKMKKTARCPPTSRVLHRRVKVSTKVEDLKKPKKFIHVHRFKQTSLFGAWFNDPSKPGKKQRLFFGCHLTAYLAARAQDRAALKFKPFALDPSSIKLNFKEEDYVADEKLREMLTCAEFGELLRKESRPIYTKMEPTPCLRQFLAEEKAKGHLPDEFQNDDKDIIPLKQYLMDVLIKRRETAKAPVISFSKESNVVQGSSDESAKDLVPTVCTAAPKSERMEHAPKVARKKRTQRRERFSSLAVLTKSVRVPSGSKPLETTPVPAVAQPKSVKEEDTGFALVWGQRRVRSKRFKPLTPIATEFKPAGTVRSKLQYKLRKVENSKSREPSPVIETESLPAEAKNIRTLEPPPIKTEFLPPGIELLIRNKWQYKLQKMEETKTSVPSPTGLNCVHNGLQMLATVAVANLV